MEKLGRRVIKHARNIDRKDLQHFIESILAANHIFVTGAGRSGLVGKSFAMRLMHLGFKVYVVGETTTPSIKQGDLLIAISGSGKTSTTTSIAKAAKKMDARVACITTNQVSPVALESDIIVKLEGKRKNDRNNEDYFSRQLQGSFDPITPLGTLFELTTMFVLDSIVEEIMVRQKKGEDFLRQLHANLE